LIHRRPVPPARKVDLTVVSESPGTQKWCRCHATMHTCCTYAPHHNVSAKLFPGFQVIVVGPFKKLELGITSVYYPLVPSKTRRVQTDGLSPWARETGLTKPTKRVTKEPNRRGCPVFAVLKRVLHRNQPCLGEEVPVRLKTTIVLCDNFEKFKNSKSGASTAWTIWYVV